MVQGYTYATTNTDRWPLVIFVSVLMCVIRFFSCSLYITPTLFIAIDVYRVAELASACFQWSWLHYYLMENYGRPVTLLSIVPYVPLVVSSVMALMDGADPAQFALRFHTQRHIWSTYFLPRGFISVRLPPWH
jgi:hypothetical protein